MSVVEGSIVEDETEEHVSKYWWCSCQYSLLLVSWICLDLLEAPNPGTILIVLVVEWSNGVAGRLERTVGDAVRGDAPGVVTDGDQRDGVWLLVRGSGVNGLTRQLETLGAAGRCGHPRTTARPLAIGRIPRVAE